MDSPQSISLNVFYFCHALLTVQISAQIVTPQTDSAQLNSIAVMIAEMMLVKDGESAGRPKR